MASHWSARLVEELLASDRHAEDLARGLTGEQLNWKPSPDVWSVGQCLQHLRVTNDVYLPPIANALAGRAASSVQQITPGWFGRWFIRAYIEPSPRSRRGRAPRKIAPGAQVEGDILERFLGSNAVARDLVRRAADYDVNRIRFVNPLIPILRFTVGTGLEIVSKHQRRHLQQAERIRRHPAFPGS